MLRAGQFAAFANGIRHFAGFAQAHADAALLVAHDNQRAEIETASAFDDFGGAVDEDDLLDQFFTALRVVIRFGFRTATSARTTAAAAATAAVTRCAAVLRLPRCSGPAALPECRLLHVIFVQPQYSLFFVVKISIRLRARHRPKL